MEDTAGNPVESQSTPTPDADPGKGTCAPWRNAMIGVSSALLLLSMYLAYHHRQCSGNVMAACALVVAAVAVYRSVLPTSYATRKVWEDHPSNSPLTIRILALFAELSIATGLYWTYSRADGIAGKQMLIRFAQFAFACLVIAQGFATYGVVSSYQWSFAVEETLWYVAAIVLAFLTYKIYQSKADPKAGWSTNLSNSSRFVKVLGVALLAYIAFSTWANVKRWGRDMGKASEAEHDDTSNVVRDCDEWGVMFIIWSTGYFVLLTALMAWLITCPAKAKSA